MVGYHFDASFKTVPEQSWYSPAGGKMTAGGYSQRSKRYRKAIRGRAFNLATDFGPKKRDWWEGNGLKVPDANLFMPDSRPTDC